MALFSICRVTSRHGFAGDLDQEVRFPETCDQGLGQGLGVVLGVGLQRGELPGRVGQHDPERNFTGVGEVGDADRVRPRSLSRKGR